MDSSADKRAHRTEETRILLIKATLREGTEPSRCCGREFDARKKCCSIVFCERQEGVRRRYWASQPFILRSVSCLQSLQKLLCRGVRMLISYPFLLCAAPLICSRYEKFRAHSGLFVFWLAYFQGTCLLMPL